MHEIDMLIDAIALKFLKSQQANTIDLFSKIKSTSNMAWNRNSQYQSTRRLRERGLIEEVNSPGREKIYRVTPKGRKTLNRVLQVLEERS